MITLLQHIAEMSTAAKLLSPFLPDRTNGRAYATVLGLSVVLCDVCCMHCAYTVRPRAKVTIDSHIGSRV